MELKARILESVFLFECLSRYVVMYFSTAVRSRLSILIFDVHSVLMEGSAGGVERGGIALQCVWRLEGGVYG